MTAWRYTADDLSQLSPFGSVLADRLSVSDFADGAWGEPQLIGIDEFSVHPGAHCLHYGSSCFEGMKGYRWEDDTVVVFRPDRHAARLQQSAKTLHLPPVEPDMFQQMVLDTVRSSAEMIPPAPGALYLRPVLIGTAPNIGAASTPSAAARFYVLASPVGNYFAAGERALRLLVEDTIPRTTPQFGRVKTGSNYANALGVTMDARAKWQVDQVLFCPKGDVQETGASNFLLIDDKTIVTKPLSDSFLHGITRHSVLTIAADLGYEVQERDYTVAELLEWTQHGEAALSGTAAVLAGVATLIHDGKEYTLSAGEPGPNTLKLRKALVDIQYGRANDAHGWTTKVN